MSDPFRVYGIVARMVIDGSRTLEDLMRFKGTNSVYAEVVDEYVPQAWVNVLTMQNLQKALGTKKYVRYVGVMPKDFSPGGPDVYVIESIFMARRWLNGLTYRMRRELFGSRRLPIDDYDFNEGIAMLSVDHPTVIDLALEYDIGEPYGDFLDSLAAHNPRMIGRVLGSDKVDLGKLGARDFVLRLIKDTVGTIRGPWVSVSSLIAIIKLAVVRGYNNVNAALLEAIGHMNIDLIWALVELGGDPTAVASGQTEDAFTGWIRLLLNLGPSTIGRPPIAKVRDLMRLMLNRGASVDRLGGYISQIAVGDRIPLLAVLLEYGADPNKLDQNADFALDFADPDGTRLLLSVPGIDIECVEKKGGFNPSTTTLLMRRGHNAVIFELLVKAGANLNAIDGQGKSVLMSLVAMTTLYYKDAVIQNINVLLKAGVDIDFADRNGRTALIQALSLKAPIEVCELLLKAGADVNKADQERRTPLMWALEKSLPLEYYRLLMSAGARADDRDVYGRSTLMYALTYMEDAVLDLLTKSDWRIRLDSGKNIFFYVASPRSLKMVSDYLGPQIAELINQQDNNGTTPLMHATARHDWPIRGSSEQWSSDVVAIIVGLIDLGADMSVKNKGGQAFRELCTHPRIYDAIVRNERYKAFVSQYPSFAMVNPSAKPLVVRQPPASQRVSPALTRPAQAALAGPAVIASLADAMANVANPLVPSKDIFQDSIREGFTIDGLRTLGAAAGIAYIPRLSKYPLIVYLIGARNRALGIQ